MKKQKSRSQRALNLASEQGWLCAYCFDPMVREQGKPNSLTIDHIVPTSKGGAKKKFNEVAACDDCNTAKGNKDPAVWIKENAVRTGYARAIEAIIRNDDNFDMD